MRYSDSDDANFEQLNKVPNCCPSVAPVIFFFGGSSDLLYISDGVCIVVVSWKGRNYGMRATLSVSCLTKFLVNSIHIYDYKSIFYENIFHN